MHQRLNERIVGAAVLVILAVIFIPMILTGPIDTAGIKETNIPPRPDDQSQSKLVPLIDKSQAIDEPSNDNESVVTENMESLLDSETATEKNDTMKLAMPEDISTPEKTPLTENKNIDKAIKKSKPATTDKAVGLSAWIVQLGSFSSQENAEKMNKDLRKAGFAAFVEPIKKQGKTVYRVRVGPELLKPDAEKILKDIKSKMKLDGIVLSYP